jgi:periplasmic protein TonB
MKSNLEQEERENRKMAGIYTLATNTIIFLLLFFVKIFEFHQPPILDGGIELNFGTDAKGSGDIQTHNKASDIKSKVESAPAPDKEEIKTKPLPPRKVEPVEPTPIKNTKPTKTAPEAPIKTSKVESPVKVPEQKETKKPTPVTNKPTSPEAKPAPAKPVEPTPQPQVNQGGLFKKSNGKSTSNGTTGTSNQPGGNNNGDGKNGEVGDQGDPKGNINAKGLYGKGGSGGGNGASLNLSGWTWSRKPVVNDDSDDVGRIVFQIKVDEEGNIMSVKVLENGVSPSVMEKYRRAVQGLDLRPTSAGSPPPVSTGTITFIIRSK